MTRFANKIERIRDIVIDREALRRSLRKSPMHESGHL